MGTDASEHLFLGRYHALERLGAGPLGETFRARVFGLGGFEKDFAVKRIHPCHSASPERMGELVRAASRAAQLYAERLARVQTVDVENGHYFLVSDLAQGLDLALLQDLLRARGERLPQDCALSIALDVAEVLESCHARTDLQPGGVTHLALSPHAVVVDAGGESRVLGMGLAQALLQHGWTADEAMQPRLAYLAPEVVAVKAPDGRADVFSLGAILHELTGGAPADPELAALIRRAIAPDLPKRLASAGELRRALEARLPERQRARHELAAAIARWMAEPAHSELAPTELTPAPPSAREWDSGEISLLSDPPPLDEAITNRVEMIDPSPPAVRPLPPALAPAPTLPPPPTLPLSAMRTPGRLAFDRLLRPAAVVALVVTSGIGLGLAVRRARLHPRDVARRVFVPRASSRLRDSLAREEPAVGSLSIASEPPGARVFVDGSLRGTSPTEVTLPVGRHRLAVVAEDRALERRTIDLDERGAKMDLALAPARVPAGSCGLKVRCATEGELRIFVDGMDTGRTCPNEERIPLEPGRHHLALYSPRTDETIAVHKEVEVEPKSLSTRVYLKY